MLRLSVKSATCILILGMLAVPLYSADKKNVETAQKEEATPKQVEEVDIETRKETCKKNLGQIGLALFMYAEDHNGTLPEKLSQLEMYIRDIKVVQCPVSNTNVKRWSDVDGKGDYIYTGNKVILKKILRPDLWIIAYDRPGNHCFSDESMSVLFADGHVDTYARGKIESFTIDPSRVWKLEEKITIACVRNLQMIGMAMHIYAIDNNGKFPPNMRALEHYQQDFSIHGLSLFSCPVTDDKIENWGQVDTNSSYVYIPGLTLKDDSITILLYERKYNHRKDNGRGWKTFLFLDGHVELRAEGYR